jgi:predicted DCC family thiol-disulfide oxidoreductase YuxK
MNPRRDWNEFWFAPISSAPLGLFRFTFGAFILLYGLMLFPDRKLWFSDEGVITRAASDAYNAVNAARPLLHPLRAVPDHPWLLLFFLLFLLAAFCLCIGLWTRLAALLVVVGLNALHNRNHIINSGADALMLVMTAYLVLAPAGAACSVDRLWRILRGQEDEEAPCIAPWAVRLMQIQIAILYLCSTLNKIPGAKWQDGTALYWALHLPEVTRFPVPFMDAEHLWLVNIATYVALATELALATLVWVPRLRLYVLTAGVFLHLGIEYSINIPLFSFLMISSYLLFLTEADLQRFRAWLQQPLAVSRLRLVYDGRYAFYRSLALVVRFLDVFRLVTFLDIQDAAALRISSEIQEREDGRSLIALDTVDRPHVGFDTFRTLAWRLPVLWLLAPLLYLPGVPWLGRRISLWITDNLERLPVAPRYTKRTASRSLRAH